MFCFLRFHESTFLAERFWILRIQNSEKSFFFKSQTSYFFLFVLWEKNPKATFWFALHNDYSLKQTGPQKTSHLRPLKLTKLQYYLLNKSVKNKIERDAVLQIHFCSYVQCLVQLTASMFIDEYSRRDRSQFFSNKIFKRQTVLSLKAGKRVKVQIYIEQPH